MTLLSAIAALFLNLFSFSANLQVDGLALHQDVQDHRPERH